MSLTGCLNELVHFPFFTTFGWVYRQKDHGQGNYPIFEKRNQNFLYYVSFVLIITHGSDFI